MAHETASSEARPLDFSARMSRRARARGAGARAPQRHFGHRLAVLAAAVAVPAVAAPIEWNESAPAPAAPAPMGFEIPGESFPGSAFYYLADTPYLPLGAGTRPADDAGTALPGSSVGRTPSESGLAGPAARAMFAAGSALDRERARKCLTMAIYYEAATEPDAGQRAVAQVVLNRVAHPSYPDTVCGVVFQGSERTTGCQFSFTCDGSLARAPARMWWDRAERVARAALGGAVYAPVGLATHYHTLQIHPYWAGSLDSVGSVGAHVFYRWRGAAGRPAAFTDRYFGGEPLAAPNPRGFAPAAPAEIDPLALARAYEAGLRSVAEAAAPPPAAARADVAPVEARGGDALLRLPVSSIAGQVRPEYAHSGQWLRQL